MARFSPSAVQAIEDFVQNLQMSSVAPAPDGSYTFAFTRAGDLSICPSEDGKRAIMSLKSRDPRRLTSEDMTRLLTLAQRDPITQTPISAGLVGGQVVLAANIRDDAFDLQKIELCLDRLIALQTAAP